jgi:predicted ABC-type ATPase
VLAGTNGAGKSSIGGAMLQASGATYFNPDEAARSIQAANPGLPIAAANSAAWHEGRRLLERAIVERLDYAFETTLGGKTMTELLERAIYSGMEVRIWYVGLRSPELHIARVRARVAKGGHDIPAADIRARYRTSLLNLVRLLPGLAELRVYDNSGEGDPDAGISPAPQPVLHMERGRIVSICDITAAPEWTKPILAAALRLQ